MSDGDAGIRGEAFLGLARRRDARTLVAANLERFRRAFDAALEACKPRDFG
jgi:hypothetical protein